MRSSQHGQKGGVKGAAVAFRGGAAPADAPGAMCAGAQLSVVQNHALNDAGTGVARGGHTNFQPLGSSIGPLATPAQNTQATLASLGQGGHGTSAQRSQQQQQMAYGARCGGGAGSFSTPRPRLGQFRQQHSAATLSWASWWRCTQCMAAACGHVVCVLGPKPCQASPTQMLSQVKLSLEALAWWEAL